MYHVICCMKSKVSYNRLKLQLGSNFIWENYIDDLEEVRENIVFKDYDLAIVDEKVWWIDDAIQLFNSRNIKVFIFEGDFEEIDRQIKTVFPEKVEVECEKDDEKKDINIDKDERPIRYITTKEIIEKEIKVPVYKYKSIYAGIQNKVIAVVNLSKRAGATFTTINLAKAISDFNVLVSVIEPPIEKPYIFDTIGLEQRLNKTEELESLNFYSYPHVIDEGTKIERDKETIEDGIIWIVADPRKKLITDWDYYKMMKLLYASKKASITFVDCGSNIKHKSIEPILSEMDILLVIIDPLPTEIMQNYDLLEEFKKLKEQGFNIEFIINKWNKGIDKKKLLDFIEIEPLMYIPFLNADLVYKSIYECKIPYSLSEVKEQLDKHFSNLIRKLLPKEIIIKHIPNNEEKKLTFKLFNKLKKRKEY